MLGYPDQARQRNHELLTLIQGLSHPLHLACVLTLTSLLISVLHSYPREEKAVQERAEAVIALCTEYAFPLLRAEGTMLRDWVLAVQGQEEAGIAQIHHGLAAWQATGARLG